MSIEALNWAANQECGTSGRQFVLHLLAWWADPFGAICYLKPEYVAEKSKQSRSTVFRHLATFEKHGVLTRTCTEYEDGSMIYGGMLHLDKSIRLPQATRQSPDEEDGVAACDSAVRVAACDSNESQRATPSLCTESLVKESSPPPTPPLDEADNDDGTKEEEENENQKIQKGLDADFEAFKLAYPWRQEMSLYAAREKFAELSIKERQIATRFAATYAAALRAKKRDFPMHAANWLKRREFEGHAGIAQAQAEQSGLAKPRFFVRKGTRAWTAWEKYTRETLGKMGLPSVFSKEHSADGWWCASLFPPTIGGDDHGEVFSDQ